ncbi:Acyl-CoA dehydrogenase/oxidase, N-terminal and middle domain containing protein [Tylopilus felleus]
MATKTLRTFTREEVAKVRTTGGVTVTKVNVSTDAKHPCLLFRVQHNTPDDLWIIIDSNVYDISRFKDLHPGGTTVLLDDDIPGQDATESFYSLHRHEVLKRPAYRRLHIGTIEGEKSVITSGEVGQLSLVPFAEPTWLCDGFHTPYYKESHRRLQQALRKFVDEVLKPEASVREESGERVSPQVVDAMGQLNIIAMKMGPGPHLKGLTLMNGAVLPEEFDCFHDLIVHQELTRHGQRGYGDGLLSGTLIGLPPIVHFGSPALKARVIPEALSGKKILCLAVTEAFSGSDVSGIRTRAIKTPDGKHWIINETKKWITNGTFADYFTVACQTDNGITVILVERGEGVDTKPIKTMYSAAAGTAYVTFDNVKVPVENTIGPKDSGILIIFSNFNHERWVMCCSGTVVQRLIIEEVFKWISQRKVFGKPLVSQAVVRSKVAAMIARAESCQNWLENLTHQMNNMSYKEQARKLAGPIALLKSHVTKCSLETAREAVEIFGGRGITKTGMGQFVEHAYRGTMFDSILGGAEAVLDDLGVRQALKDMPDDVRL